MLQRHFYYARLPRPHSRNAMTGLLVSRIFRLVRGCTACMMHGACCVALSLCAVCKFLALLFMDRIYSDFATNYKYRPVTMNNLLEKAKSMSKVVVDSGAKTMLKVRPGCWLMRWLRCRLLAHLFDVLRMMGARWIQLPWTTPSPVIYRYSYSLLWRWICG